MSHNRFLPVAPLLILPLNAICLPQSQDAAASTAESSTQVISPKEEIVRDYVDKYGVSTERAWKHSAKQLITDKSLWGTLVGLELIQRVYDHRRKHDLPPPDPKALRPLADKLKLEFDTELAIILEKTNAPLSYFVVDKSWTDLKYTSINKLLSQTPPNELINSYLREFVDNIPFVSAVLRDDANAKVRTDPATWSAIYQVGSLKHDLDHTLTRLWTMSETDPKLKSLVTAFTYGDFRFSPYDSPETILLSIEDSHIAIALKTLLDLGQKSTTTNSAEDRSQMLSELKQHDCIFDRAAGMLAEIDKNSSGLATPSPAAPADPPKAQPLRHAQTSALTRTLDAQMRRDEYLTRLYFLTSLCSTFDDKGAALLFDTGMSISKMEDALLTQAALTKHYASLLESHALDPRQYAEFVGRAKLNTSLELAGLALSLLTTLLSAEQTPIEVVILEEVKETQEMVAQLAQQLNSRLDYVDAQLRQLRGFLVDNFAALDLEVADLKYRVSRCGSQLNELSAGVSRLTPHIYRVENYLRDHTLKQRLYEISLQADIGCTKGISYDRFVECLKRLEKCALELSHSPMYTGADISLGEGRGYLASAYGLHIGSKPESMVSYLARLARTRYGSQALFATSSSHANAGLWATSVEGLFAVITCHPELYERYRVTNATPVDFERLINTGKAIRASRQSLVDEMATGVLPQRLVQDYSRAYDNVKNQLLMDVDVFVHPNTRLRGYNPWLGLDQKLNGDRSFIPKELEPPVDGVRLLTPDNIVLLIPNEFIIGHHLGLGQLKLACHSVRLLERGTTGLCKGFVVRLRGSFDYSDANGSHTLTVFDLERSCNSGETWQVHKGKAASFSTAAANKWNERRLSHRTYTVGGKPEVFERVFMRPRHFFVHHWTEINPFLLYEPSELEKNRGAIVGWESMDAEARIRVAGYDFAPHEYGDHVPQARKEASVTILRGLIKERFVQKRREFYSQLAPDNLAKYHPALDAALDELAGARELLTAYFGLGSPGRTHPWMVAAVGQLPGRAELVEEFLAGLAQAAEAEGTDVVSTWIRTRHADIRNRELAPGEREKFAKLLQDLYIRLVSHGSPSKRARWYHWWIPTHGVLETDKIVAADGRVHQHFLSSVYGFEKLFPGEELDRMKPALERPPSDMDRRVDEGIDELVVIGRGEAAGGPKDAIVERLVILQRLYGDQWKEKAVQ